MVNIFNCYPRKVYTFFEFMYELGVFFVNVFKNRPRKLLNHCQAIFQSILQLYLLIFNISDSRSQFVQLLFQLLVGSIPSRPQSTQFHRFLSLEMSDLTRDGSCTLFKRSHLHLLCLHLVGYFGLLRFESYFLFHFHFHL